MEVHQLADSALAQVHHDSVLPGIVDNHTFLSRVIHCGRGSTDEGLLGLLLLEVIRGEIEIFGRWHHSEFRRGIREELMPCRSGHSLVISLGHYLSVNDITWMEKVLFFLALLTLYLMGRVFIVVVKDSEFPFCKVNTVNTDLPNALREITLFPGVICWILHRSQCSKNLTSYDCFFLGYFFYLITPLSHGLFHHHIL